MHTASQHKLLQKYAMAHGRTALVLKAIRCSHVFCPAPQDQIQMMPHRDPCH